MRYTLLSTATVTNIRNATKAITTTVAGNGKNPSRFYSSLYEPPYLNLLKQPHPSYDVINFKLTGFDYSTLESYHRFVHKIAKSLDFVINESWAHPPRKTKIVRLKPNSLNIETEYFLTTYERYIQLSDVQSPIYSTFLRFVQSGLPEGVKISVVHHTDHIAESRFVPDKELLDLKTQLTLAGGALTKSRR